MTGTLQFWNVTIDTASSILIILSVGLAVDYSAHVGHTFMTISGEREGLCYKSASSTIKIRSLEIFIAVFLKMQLFCFRCSNLSKTANAVANIVDPNQTAPLGAV